MAQEDRESRNKAVALRYDAQKDAAPKIVAKGSGLLAERIIELARQNNVHIHQDPQMVDVLAQVQIDAPIPEQLYNAIAQILAFVYRLEQRLP